MKILVLKFEYHLVLQMTPEDILTLSFENHFALQGGDIGT